MQKSPYIQIFRYELRKRKINMPITDVMRCIVSNDTGTTIIRGYCYYLIYTSHISNLLDQPNKKADKTILSAKKNELCKGRFYTVNFDNLIIRSIHTWFNEEEIFFKNKINSPQHYKTLFSLHKVSVLGIYNI